MGTSVVVTDGKGVYTSDPLLFDQTKSRFISVLDVTTISDKSVPLAHGIEYSEDNGKTWSKLIEAVHGCTDKEAVDRSGKPITEYMIFCDVNASKTVLLRSYIDTKESTLSTVITPSAI